MLETECYEMRFYRDEARTLLKVLNRIKLNKEFMLDLSDDEVDEFYDALDHIQQKILEN